MYVGIDGEDMLRGQLVLPPDFDWRALLHVEDWPGYCLSYPIALWAEAANATAA